MYRGGRPVLTKRSFYYDRRKNRTERFFDSSNRFPAVGARVHARGTSYANRKAKSRRIFRKSDRRACSRREYIAFPPNCSSFTERHGTVERHGTLPRPPLSLSLSLSHSLSHSLSLSPLSFPLSLPWSCEPRRRKSLDPTSNSHGGFTHCHCGYPFLEERIPSLCPDHSSKSHRRGRTSGETRVGTGADLGFALGLPNSDRGTD